MKKILVTTALCCLAVTVNAAQQTISQVPAQTTVGGLRAAYNAELAKQQANNTELYTAVAAKANTSAFASAEAFEAAFGWAPGEGTYTLPTASGSVLGGVKVGSRLSIADGVLSADVQTTDISGKQDTLVSGTNIKTINSTSILGSGNITISGSMTWPASAGIMVYGGSSAYGTSLALDTDASTVSSNHDSVFSAKTVDATFQKKTDAVQVPTWAETFLEASTAASALTSIGGQAAIVQATDCSTYTTAGQLCVQY